MVAIAVLLKGNLFYLLLIGVATVVTVTTVKSVGVIGMPDDLQTTTLNPTVTESTITLGPGEGSGSGDGGSGGELGSTTEPEEGSGSGDGSGDGSGTEFSIGSSRLSKFLSVNTFTNSEEFKDHEDLISEGFMRIRQQ